MNVPDEFFHKYKDEDYCGKLHSGGQSYFLLYPYPIVKDSWQSDNAQRFLVVPMKPIGKQGDVELFSYPRHVVSTCYTVEYHYLQETIRVLDLGDYSAEEYGKYLHEDVKPDPNYVQTYLDGEMQNG